MTQNKRNFSDYCRLLDVYFALIFGPCDMTQDYDTGRGPALVKQMDWMYPRLSAAERDGIVAHQEKVYQARIATCSTTIT